MNLLALMGPLPSMVEESKRNKWDVYYTLPRIVECFVDRANQELPWGFVVRPWTLNRCVTLFRGSVPLHTLAYLDIEEDIVACLDKVNELAEWYVSRPARHPV